jgi:WD40 repeat protein
LWDTASGALTDTLVGHMAGVNCLAWSPDSETIASGSDDKTVRLWDRVTGRPKMSAKSGELVVVGSGGSLVPGGGGGGGGGGGAAAAAAATTKRSLAPMPPLLGHHNYVVSVAFSPRGNVLASGSFDEAVFLWDVRAGRLMRSLPAHSDPVCGLDFCLDGTMVVSCSTDGLVRIWDATTGQCLRTLVHEDNPAITSVCFAPGGHYVLAWSLDSCIRLWDYVSGAVKKTYQGHRNSRFAVGGCFALSSRRKTTGCHHGGSGEHHGDDGDGCDDCDGYCSCDDESCSASGSRSEFESESDSERGPKNQDHTRESGGNGDGVGHDNQPVGSLAKGSDVDGDIRGSRRNPRCPRHPRDLSSERLRHHRRRRRRHQYSLIISPSEDGRVLVWDVTTKLLVQTLDCHGGGGGGGGDGGGGVCFWVDTNAGTLVTAGQDCTMRIYHSDRLGRTRPRATAAAATESENGAKFASVADGGDVGEVRGEVGGMGAMGVVGNEKFGTALSPRPAHVAVKIEDLEMGGS